MTSVFSWQNSVFAMLHFVLQGQICLLLQISLDSYFAVQSPMMKKIFLGGVLVLEGLVDLHRTIQLQLLQHWGIELDYCDIEWFSLETNRDHSVIFEIAMAPHSSTLAWKIPWTEEPGRLQSVGSLRVGHD